MIEKITLRIFWLAMLLCASSVLILIWFGEEMIPERIAPTFFIIGLANLLIWLPIMIYRFLEKNKK